MTSQEIIKGIRSIYARFPVPENLQSHLFSVAAVGACISDHWTGTLLNRDDLIAYLLLHDLGNIIKYDFSRQELLTPNMRENIEHWKKAQHDAWNRYGKDDHAGTRAMAREIGASSRILELLEQDDFRNLDVVAEKDDWEQKVGKYSDYRAGPSGIISLLERMAELRKRYAGKPSIAHDPELRHLESTMVSIEKQIFSHCTLKPEDINDALVKKYIESF